MLEVIEKLLILRERDRIILETEAELRGLATERAAADTRSHSAEQAHEAAKHKANEIETARKQLELEVTSNEESIAKFAHQQLETKDNKEYQAFAREIEHCRKKISDLEDQELELMVQADEQAEVVATAQKDLDAANADKASAHAAIDEREKNLQSLLDDTNAQRDEISEQVDDSTLDRYERLLTNKGPSAVSGIDHAVCGHCHMKLPPQVIVDCKHGEKVNFCPHCGVIIYYTSKMVLEAAVDEYD